MRICCGVEVWRRPGSCRRRGSPACARRRGTGSTTTEPAGATSSRSRPSQPRSGRPRACVQRAGERQEAAGRVGEARRRPRSGRPSAAGDRVRSSPTCPRLMAVWPSRSPSPSAAPMLSPVPGPTTVPRAGPARRRPPTSTLPARLAAEQAREAAGVERDHGWSRMARRTRRSSVDHQPVPDASPGRWRPRRSGRR